LIRNLDWICVRSASREKVLEDLVFGRQSTPAAKAMSLDIRTWVTLRSTSPDCKQLMAGVMHGIATTYLFAT
jgi:hypothetical protein